mmetsp:Transcript_49696/g.126603  ORF Transcript_49696/g.126603 Transcript_49696/m.126603 type:complete len:168 (-) Transcript_49696:140-643(-)
MWKEGAQVDVVWMARRSPNVQAAWNWIYTFWDTVFMYNNFLTLPGGFLMIAAQIAPLLLGGARAPGAYLQARAYSLHVFITMDVVTTLVLGTSWQTTMHASMGAMPALPAYLSAGLQYVSFIFCAFAFGLRHAAPVQRKYAGLKNITEELKGGGGIDRPEDCEAHGA